MWRDSNIQFNPLMNKDDLNPFAVLPVMSYKVFNLFG